MGFTDLLSSSRGPGVIGTLLALLVLVGFGTLYLFVFDEGLQGGGMTIEGVLKHQSERIETLKIQINNGEQRLVDAREAKARGAEADQLIAINKSSESQIAELTAQVEEAEKEVAAATATWEKYKDEYRASEWASAVGEKLPDINTADGEVFSNVVIKLVDHTGVRINHSSGSKTIKPEDLPFEIHDRFQFSKEKTDESREKIAENADEHSKSVDVAQRAKKAQDKLMQVDRLKKENKNLSEQIIQSKRSLPRKQVAVDRMRSNIRTEKSKKGGISRAPEMQVKLRAMERALSEFRRSIPEMQRTISDNRRQISRLERDVDTLRYEIDEIKKKIRASEETTEAP